MQMKKLFYSILAVLFILFGTKIQSQTFGFGCLGFVGGYGGYTYQHYNAKGLNEFIEGWNSLEFLHEQMEEFSFATGYRVGLNFFRASFEGGFMVTAKGYYQSLGKTNKAKLGDANSEDFYTLDMDMKNWAIGFDVGIDITSGISWKILDGAVHFNSVTLTETNNSPGNSEIEKYKNETGKIGYSVGSGVIITIIKDYISIEGLAGYTFLTIDEMKTEEGTPFPTGPYTTQEPGNFIDSGGFTAVVQINVGFPL